MNDPAKSTIFKKPLFLLMCFLVGALLSPIGGLVGGIRLNRQMFSDFFKSLNDPFPARSFSELLLVSFIAFVMIMTSILVMGLLFVGMIMGSILKSPFRAAFLGFKNEANWDTLCSIINYLSLYQSESVLMAMNLNQFDLRVFHDDLSKRKIETFAKAVESGQRFDGYYLQLPSIKDEEAERLATLLKRCRTGSLIVDLSNSFITDKGADKIVDAIHKDECPPRLEIKLQDCMMLQHGAIRIEAALKKHHIQTAEWQSSTFLEVIQRLTMKQSLRQEMLKPDALMNIDSMIFDSACDLFGSMETEKNRFLEGISKKNQQVYSARLRFLCSKQGDVNGQEASSISRVGVMPARF